MNLSKLILTLFKEKFVAVFIATYFYIPRLKNINKSLNYY